MKDGIRLPLVARAEHHAARTAILDSTGSHTYRDLLDASAHVAAALLAGRDDLREERVAFLVAPSFAWVAVQWGIWRAGAIAVPLPMGSPPAELEYFLHDTQASVLIYNKANEEVAVTLAKSRGIRVTSYEETGMREAQDLPRIDDRRRAMILYTSGTTSCPKGVVTTHANITAQIASLIEAWEWSADDRIVLCLPLHHVHGIINVVSCALWAGAVCEMLPRFDAGAIWDRIARGGITLFMAVPTIYVRLIAAWEASSSERRDELSRAAAKLRLMVSGSAALPISTLQRWREITGHTLLERYGMTEIGMALSNSYRGDRFPGCVGSPLPGVEVRLVHDAGTQVRREPAGEIEVRGANVFLEYWGNPDATREAFRDGWFRTGDTAVVEDGVYRILGRTNIDILKTGGHKVSALEIEEALRDHPAIAECAVVGVADEEWGERVGAALVLREGNTLELEELREWGKQRLAAHKVPSRLLLLDALPRNAMGKVTKPAIKSLFERKAEIS
ncbi:MAG TPA: acyl-CoA synthetase [Terriglobales bacterium]